MLADEPDAFGRFAERGWGRVAWSIVVEPRGAGASRVTVELRVDATDDDAWRAVHRYFAVIGPFSRFIRRQMLRRKIPPLRVVEVEDGRWAVALGGGVAGDPACSSGSKSAPSTPRIGRDVR